MATVPFTREQVKEFIRQNAIAGIDAEQSLRHALDADYWRSLCPRLTVGRDARTSSVPVTAVDGQRVTEAAHEYEVRGFLSLTGIFDPADISGLKEAVFAVHKAGWPMIFALVYDQFWSLLRTERFVALLNRIAGPRYQPTVLFWMHHVPTIPGAKGFPPHKDGGCGFPTVSCWIPLSPATLDNGCMYVVERTPVVDEIAGSFGSFRSFTKRQMNELLSHTQALPIDPGGLLAWQHTTLHWGGTYKRGGIPRLAVSWEFTTAEYNSKDDALRKALYPEEPLPQLQDRLRWIAKAILSFRGRDLIMERFVPMLLALLREVQLAD